MTISRSDLDNGRVDLSEAVTGERLPPIHPGEILKTEWLEPLGISAYRLAKDINVPANRITEILLGRRSISPDTALRLARYFATDAESWVNLQARYDLDVARLEMAEQVTAEVRPYAA